MTVLVSSTCATHHRPWRQRISANRGYGSPTASPVTTHTIAIKGKRIFIDYPSIFGKTAWWEHRKILHFQSSILSWNQTLWFTWAAQRLQHHQQARRCHQATECMEKIAPPGLRTSAGVEHLRALCNFQASGWFRDVWCMSEPRVQADLRETHGKMKKSLFQSPHLIDRHNFFWNEIIPSWVSQTWSCRHIASWCHLATNTSPVIALGIRGQGNIMWNELILNIFKVSCRDVQPKTKSI